MTSPVLALPAYKVFLDQLTNVEKSSNGTNLHQWKVHFKCPSLNSNFAILTSNVWIQCEIISILDDSFIVADESGIGWVTGISKLPQPSKNFNVKDYVMVLGHILSCGPFSSCTTNHFLRDNKSVCAKLKAIKVTELSSNKSCKSGRFWKKEVIDAQNHVVLSYQAELKSELRP